MSVEASQTTGFISQEPFVPEQRPAIEQQAAWAPPVSGLTETEANAHPGQNYARDYDPDRAHYQPGYAAVSPVDASGSINNTEHAVQNIASPPLPDTTKNFLYKMSRSKKAEDIETFGKLYNSLFTGQKEEFQAFKNARIEQMLQARNTIPEVQPGADPEAWKYVLYGLKLRSPSAFAQQFAGLGAKEKGQFDAFEAGQDARVKVLIPQAGHLAVKVSTTGNIERPV